MHQWKVRRVTYSLDRGGNSGAGLAQQLQRRVNFRDLHLEESYGNRKLLDAVGEKSIRGGGQQS
jgi:hypothetical protein